MSLIILETHTSELALDLKEIISKAQLLRLKTPTEKKKGEIYFKP